MAEKMPRMVASYRFEGGDYVEIIASENVATSVALDQAELIIRMKRYELEHGPDGAKMFAADIAAIEARTLNPSADGDSNG